MQLPFVCSHCQLMSTGEPISPYHQIWRRASHGAEKVGHGSCFLTRRAPRGEAKPDCRPTGKLLHSGWSSEDAMPLKPILCLVTEIGGKKSMKYRPRLEEERADEEGFVPAPLLVSNGLCRTQEPTRLLFHRAVRTPEHRTANFQLCSSLFAPVYLRFSLYSL